MGEVLIAGTASLLICIFLSLFCLAYFRVTRRLNPEAVR